MRELAILTFVTLDGVMQAPAEAREDRSGAFTGAGWAKPYWDDVMAQVGRTAMAQPYDMLLGRRTYDIFKRAASQDDESGPMDKAKKYVVTSSPDSLGWINAHGVSGNISAEVGKLKQQDGPLLQVHGSWQLIQLLQAQDLIDEYRLWTFPVTLGQGKRLFAEGGPARAFDLIRSEPTGNGTQMSIYRGAKA